MPNKQQQMRHYGQGRQTERGKKLLEFATKHYLITTNGLPTICKNWTWRALSEYHNMIDLILIEKKGKRALRNCQTYHGADISSDLVMTKLQLRVKGNQNTMT